MRRLIVLSVLLLAIDQGTKTVAQFTLEGREILVGGGWGLTYLVHEGIWVWTSIPPAMLWLAHIALIVLWLYFLAARRWYVRWYRESIAVDLAMAALTVSAYGNLIDRLLVGGARDWWVTPIAVANIADNTQWLALAAIVWELWRYPPSRNLLVIPRHLDPRKDLPPPEQRPRGAPGAGRPPQLRR